MKNTRETVKCEHTPTPWEFAYGSIYKSGDGREINDENAIRIALMDRNEEATKPTERDANAAFIVTACNAHGVLLDACKAMQEWLSHPEVRFLICDGGRANLGECSAYNRTMQAARKAISLATTT